MGELKTLADCKPSEFLRQTNKVRKSVEKWLDLTKIREIRKQKRYELETIPETASLSDAVEIRERNQKRLEKNAMENISEMLDAIMEKYPDETLELLALCCFVEPENVDNYPITEYLEAFTSLINNKAVLGFFTSLIALVRTGTSSASKA